MPENDAATQRITNELYGGGPEERLAQELVLGIGGARALRALGAEPQICHLNEGHAVFTSLERMRHLMETQGLSFLEARQATNAGHPLHHSYAGLGRLRPLPESLISHDLGPTLKQLGLTVEQFMRMGRIHPDDPHEDFNVAVLALRQAPRRNAVSRLHRRVTARMMQPGWVDFPLSEMPVGSVTNGVHTKTWVAADMAQLFDHHLGPRWRDDASNREVWQRVDRIPDLELWRDAFPVARAACGVRPRRGGGTCPGGALGDGVRGLRSPLRRSGRMLSPSGSPGGSPPTSGPRSCSATSPASRPSSRTRPGRSSSCFRAKLIPATAPVRNSSARCSTWSSARA